MTFTKEQVRQACDLIAPQHEFSPKLIYAVCLQEGGKDSSGKFAPDIARLEQGFYRKYVEKHQALATTSEVLLAASYGIMQMMGESLRLVGFFQWYYEHQSNTTKARLGDPLSQIAIPKAIDEYCENLEWMIEWGCKWMSVKRARADGDVRKMLTYWNGSSKYPDEIFERMKDL